MFIIRRYKTILLLSVLLGLMFFVRWGAAHSVFEMLVYGPLAELRGGALNTLLPYGNVENLKNMLAEEEENVRRLRVENARLRERMGRMKSSREAEKWGEVSSGGFVTARVVGRLPGSWTALLWVDRGNADGVKTGAMVLDGGGLVGRVVRTKRRRALVQLITAPGAATSCRLQPSNARGIVMGNGSGRLNVDFIAARYPVKRGDTVETSGMGGHYPPGIPIARITRVDSETRQLTLPLEAAAAADLSHLDFVTIIAEEAGQ